MGFGSYDESEQENQDVEVSEDSEVTMEGEYNGDEEFEFGDADTGDLVDQLQEMKDSDE